LLLFSVAAGAAGWDCRLGLPLLLRLAAFSWRRGER